MPHASLNTLVAGAATLALSAAGLARAEPAPAAAHTYAVRAPAEQYQMAATDEVALARSAAPDSISSHAEVLSLGPHGYETAAPGQNGFVCLVQRAWASDFANTEFWNPKERAPICFNAAAARTVLPGYLERTRWVLAGASKPEMEARTRAAVAAGKGAAPAVGAMSFMMSRRGYLNDDAGGPWHPHLMFFLPPGAGGTAAWGANLPGAPVIGGADDIERVATLMVPVRRWSDGTPDGDAAGPHAMTMAPPNPR
jgi:hypothetical protein